MSPFAAYRAHFEANRTRPLPPVEAPALPEARRAALASSLARFQLGETGEGRIAQTIDRVQLPLVDDDYRASLKLFVAEEGRHARVLALMVKALGGRMLQKSWSHGVFSRARNLVGVRFKMLVLLAAEVIAVGFYGAIAEALPAGPMADALKQICADEQVHFDFHCEFLRGQSVLFRWLWWPIGGAAALAVLLDHRGTIRAFSLKPRLFARVKDAAAAMRGPLLRGPQTPVPSAGRLSGQSPEGSARRQIYGAPALTQLMTRHRSYVGR